MVTYKRFANNYCHIIEVKDVFQFSSLRSTHRSICIYFFIFRFYRRPALCRGHSFQLLVPTVRAFSHYVQFMNTGDGRKIDQSVNGEGIGLDCLTLGKWNSLYGLLPLTKSNVTFTVTCKMFLLSFCRDVGVHLDGWMIFTPWSRKENMHLYPTCRNKDGGGKSKW